jgi:Tfp pilus assembly protein PilV
MDRAMKRRGFSLAEIVLAVFLLGLVIGCVLNLLPYSLLLVSHGEARYQAVQLAQDALEQQARQPWSSLVTATVSQTIVQRGSREFTLQQAAPQRRSPALCHLVVTVSWSEQGQPRTIREELDVAELHW